MQVFFGHSLERVGIDSYVQLNEQVIAATSLAGSPAAYIVNTFPIREIFLVDVYPVGPECSRSVRFWPAWLPGGSFKQDAKNGRIMAKRLRDVSLDLAKTKMVSVWLVTSQYKGIDCILDKSEANCIESFLASNLQGSRSPEHRDAALAVATTSYGGIFIDLSDIYISMTTRYFPLFSRSRDVDIHTPILHFSDGSLS